MIKETKYYTAECSACRMAFRGDGGAPDTPEKLADNLRKAGWAFKAEDVVTDKVVGGEVICTECVARASRAFAAVGARPSCVRGSRTTSNRGVTRTMAKFRMVRAKKNPSSEHCPTCGEQRIYHPNNSLYTCPVPPAVTEALQEFKALNGVRWRAKLRSLWTSGEDEGRLRQARNMIGPNRLDNLTVEEIPTHAFTAVAIPGRGFMVGRADLGKKGFTPQREHGRFGRHEEAKAVADRLNKELGLTDEQVWKLVMGTMPVGSQQ